METASNQGRDLRLALGGGLAVLVVFLVARALPLVGPSAEEVVSNGGSTVLAVMATLLLARRWRTSIGSERRAVATLSAAVACLTAGDLLWLGFLLVDVEVDLSPADVFYVAAYPVAAAAMLLLQPGRMSAARRVRAIADGLITGSALLFLSWAFVIGDLLRQWWSNNPLEVTVWAFYPLGDVVLVSIAISVAVRTTGRARVPLLLVAAGFAAIAVGDTGYTFLALHGGSAVVGYGLDLTWAAGYLLLAAAATVPFPFEDHDPAPLASSRRLAQELVPYVPVGGVLIAVAIGGSSSENAALISILVTMVTLLIIRHFLTLRENLRLAMHLERLVDQRTQELGELTTRHASILDNAGEGIVEVDGEGRVAFANPAAFRLLATETQQTLGTPLRDLVRPASGDDCSGSPLAEAVRTTLLDGRTRTVSDFAYARLDDSEAAVDVTVTCTQRDAADTGAILMMRDVSQRRAMDKMKHEFVSIVSHELRTPLTSLRAALGLMDQGLQQQHIQGPFPQMMGIAVSSTDRLIRLINDILDVQKMQAGKLALRPRPITATDLITLAVTEMHGFAHENEVTLHVAGAGGTVEADPDRIVQTLTNLISNAVKFSPRRGSVLINAELRPDAQVVFTVRDSGPGIPADQLRTIFEPFRQADSSNSRPKTGTGLGLTVCEGIIEQHGGTIWADSDGRTGSCFSFLLPAAASSAMPVAHPHPRELVPAGQYPKGA